MSHAQLAEMMSHFLKGQGHGQVLSSGPELLPMLQSVCGQVTQLRLDDAAAAAEKENKLRNGSWYVGFNKSINCVFQEDFAFDRKACVDNVCLYQNQLAVVAQSN